MVSGGRLMDFVPGRQVHDRGAMTRMPVEVDYSAEFRYRSPAIDDRTMLIAVSQSGETADTLAALEEGRRCGCHLLAMTNTVDSSIARKADAQIYTRCGPEISVTTTKCFLTQIEAFYLFAIHLAARLGRITEREAEETVAASLRDSTANRSRHRAASARSKKSRASTARRATSSISAAASTTRSRSRARSSSRKFPTSTPKAIRLAR
jgi:glucosamine 6-phosphate synthetase-like amidotransferase/phosphosugar isomerase protein